MSSTTSQNPIQYRGTSTNGSYYFCIEGLPKRYTWQDLKDSVRKQAAHGIWTEMAFSSNGQSGEIGWARVQRSDEAGKLYTFLANNAVQGRRLRIHLFDTSASPPRLIKHTCGTAPCIVTARTVEAHRPVVSPTVPQPNSTMSPYTQQSSVYAVQLPYTYATTPTTTSPIVPRYPLASPMYALQSGMQGMRIDMVDPAIVAAARARMVQANAQQIASQQPVMQRRVQSQVQVPVYALSPTGTFVNVSQGTIKTEVRGVFVSGIDYKAGTKDLQRFFSTAGEIVSCQLQKDPATSKSKGNATVQYAAANDAKNAVRLFNNEKYMGMRLKVRLDKEPVAVGMPPASSSRSNGNTGTSSLSQQSRNSTDPIIANGSICQK